MGPSAMGVPCSGGPFIQPVLCDSPTSLQPVLAHERAATIVAVSAGAIGSGSAGDVGIFPGSGWDTSSTCQQWKTNEFRSRGALFGIALGVSQSSLLSFLLRPRLRGLPDSHGRLRS